MRRTLIILFSILLFMALGIGAYALFFTPHAKVVVTSAPSGNVFPSVGGGGVGGANATGTLPTIVSSATSTGAGTPSSTQPRLMKVSSGPVVPGIVVFDATTTSASSTPAIIQYLSKQNGNIYSYTIASGALARISNKTIPGIQSARWLSDGSLVYVRYFSHIKGASDIQTYALPSNGIGGFPLDQGLAGVSTYKSNALLTVASGANGSSVIRAKTDASGAYTAFQTPLSSIIASFAGPHNYLFYTKSSANLKGYAFLVRGKTGAVTQIAGPLTGLIALPNHAGTEVLISYTQPSGAMATELVNTKKHTVINLPIQTLADKCVWTADDSALYCGVPTNAPTASYPDEWYQGAVSFNDEIWKIDVVGRYAEPILDFQQETGRPLDATALAVDPQNTVLSFVNKRDGSLWEYRLKP